MLKNREKYVESENEFSFSKFPMSYQWLSGSALKLVDGMCQIQTPVAFVELAVQSFQ